MEAQEQAVLEKRSDPSKDFKSLDNYITYSLPEGWRKEDQVDQESGNNTFTILTSDDYESPETFIINSGVRITISRNYDPKAEETLNSKINAQYEFYDYNIRSITIGGKNAMTMHEDYEGHNRFIYIASGLHLWQISIASKDLDSEQKYDLEINNFLDSIQFKD